LIREKDKRQEKKIKGFFLHQRSKEREKERRGEEREEKVWEGVSMGEKWERIAMGEEDKSLFFFFFLLLCHPKGMEEKKGCCRASRGFRRSRGL